MCTEIHYACIVNFFLVGPTEASSIMLLLLQILQSFCYDTGKE